MMDWISVKDKMPQHGVKVLATYQNNHGKNRIIIGHHIERYKEESECFDECNDEYHEDTDNYYYCEGWYEQMDNNSDYSSMFVAEGDVTHWMPLPKCPSQGENSKEKTCLTCEFEPEWMTRTEFGDCKWKGIMPPFSAIRIERSSIFKSKPIENCPAWRPGKNRVEVKTMLSS